MLKKAEPNSVVKGLANTTGHEDNAGILSFGRISLEHPIATHFLHVKKILLITIISVATGIGAAYAGNGTQSLSFNDGNGVPNSGTYNSTDTITFDISVTFAGYNSPGLSFWLEAQNGIAPFLHIQSISWGTTFPDSTTSPPNVIAQGFASPTGASPGFLSEVPDLGSTGDPFTPAPPGTYLEAHITLSITGASPGIFILQSTVVSPHASEVSDNKFNDHNIVPPAQYMIIVPEPTTLALIGMTAVGGAFIARRRRVLKG